jgi:predicted RNase H-like nuclease (RuvC/YqgF family)
MSQAKPSKLEQGAEHARRLARYIEERRAAKNFPMHLGRLHKSKIAEELGFARSVLLQNPACKAMINALEKEVPGADEDNDISGSSQNAQQTKFQDPRRRALEQRVTQLEHRNAALIAEKEELAKKLRSLQWLDRNIDKGRLPW